jgi:hypothetical protein
MPSSGHGEGTDCRISPKLQYLGRFCQNPSAAGNCLWLTVARWTHDEVRVVWMARRLGGTGWGPLCDPWWCDFAIKNGDWTSTGFDRLIFSAWEIRVYPTIKWGVSCRLKKGDLKLKKDCDWPAGDAMSGQGCPEFWPKNNGPVTASGLENSQSDPVILIPSFAWSPPWWSFQPRIWKGHPKAQRSKACKAPRLQEPPRWMVSLCKPSFPPGTQW